MGLASLTVTRELFETMLAGLSAGEPPRYFRVVKNPIPDDAKLVDVLFVRSSGYVHLVFESSTVPDGDPCVWPQLTLEAVYLPPEAVNGRS